MSADPNRMNGTVLHHKLAVHLGEIACMFRGAPKLTLVVRNPTFGDADVVIGDDDPEEAVAAIRRMHAPCDEPAKREDGLPAEGQSPAGAVGEAEAPDLKALQADNDRLTTALAESERKRVEERAALAALYEWYDRDGSVGGASDVFAAHRALLATPTQETPR